MEHNHLEGSHKLYGYGRYCRMVRSWRRTRLHFINQKAVVTFRGAKDAGQSGKDRTFHLRLEIDVLANVLVEHHLVSRSSSSCGSERAGHSTASSRSPWFCRCATRVFPLDLLWRQLEAWQVESALHAIRRQGGPKVCPTNGPPLPSSANHHRLFFLIVSSLSSSFFIPFFPPFFHCIPIYPLTCSFSLPFSLSFCCCLPCRPSLFQYFQSTTRETHFVSTIYLRPPSG